MTATWSPNRIKPSGPAGGWCTNPYGTRAIVNGRGIRSLAPASRRSRCGLPLMIAATTPRQVDPASANAPWRISRHRLASPPSIGCSPA